MSGTSATLPLLALPQSALALIFHELRDLADCCSLSRCNKELWALGRPFRRRHMCCAACGHAVLEPAVAFNSDTWRQAPSLELPDGDSYAVDVEHLLPGNRLSEERPLLAYPTLLSLRAEAGIRGVGTPGFEVQAQHVHCGGCGLSLGLRITQLGKLRVGQAAACIRYWRELQLLGTCLLGKRYLRLRAPDDGREEHLGAPPPPGGHPAYVCTAARSSLRKPGECGSVLCERRDVLSKQHCWDAGGGPERAYYVNGFRPGAVVVCNERQEMLCQGDMQVADVHCATCGARIGWKFCQDLTEGQDNCNQVGRFGVVKSSIKKQHKK